jgi:hypothetical protein
MRFAINFDKITNTNGTIFYRSEEFAFDTVPAPVSDCASVLLDDVNLELDGMGKVVSIWGLCPHTSWKKAMLSPPEAKAGEIIALYEQPLKPGISSRITPAGMHLDTYFDQKNGWVMIKRSDNVATSVCIMPGVIIDLDAKEELATLWIKPVFE